MFLAALFHFKPAQVVERRPEIGSHLVSPVKQRDGFGGARLREKTAEEVKRFRIRWTGLAKFLFGVLVIMQTDQGFAKLAMRAVELRVGQDRLAAVLRGLTVFVEAAEQNLGANPKYD